MKTKSPPPCSAHQIDQTLTLRHSTIGHLKGRLPAIACDHRADGVSAPAHLALMFLRVICIGVNGVPFFFA
jgi:hypothetical protein